MSTLPVITAAELAPRIGRTRRDTELLLRSLRRQGLAVLEPGRGWRLSARGEHRYGQWLRLLSPEGGHGG